MRIEKILSSAFILAIFLFIGCQQGPRYRRSDSNDREPDVVEEREDYTLPALREQGYNFPEVSEGDVVLCPVTDAIFTVKYDTPYVEIKNKRYYVASTAFVEPLKRNPNIFLKRYN